MGVIMRDKIFKSLIKSFLVTFISLLLIRFIWILMFAEEFDWLPALRAIGLGISLDIWLASIFYLIWLPSFLLFFWTKKQTISMIKVSMGKIAAFMFWFSLISLILFHFLDVGYYIWSKTRLDMVFIHNLGWESFKMILATIGEVKSHSYLSTAIVVTSLFIITFIIVQRKLWRGMKSQQVEYNRLFWIKFSSVVVMLAIFIIPESYLHKAIKIRHHFWQEAARSPVLVLGKEFIRQLKVRAVVLNEKKAYEHINKLREIWQKEEGIVFNKKLEKQGFPLARKHTDICFQHDYRQSCPQTLKNKRPNIILIVVESLSAAVVQSLGKHKYPTTPNFDNLASEGILFNNFFANGFQTASGLVAILCSQYPNYGERFTRTGLGRRLLCLPDILKQYGYQTSFFTGSSISYDNMHHFLASHNYDKVFGWGHAPQNPNVGPWGLHDGETVKEILKHLEQSDRNDPFFLTFLTISNHGPFSLPDKKFQYFKNEQLGKKFSFFNAVRYTDFAIGQLIEGLEKLNLMDNSLVVITADHSLDYEDNNLDLFHAHVKRDTMWIPFLLYGPKVLSAKGSKGQIGSQVDILPTLLTLMQIDIANSFMGRNLFNNNRLKDGYALHFNHYQNNLAALIKGKFIYKYHLPKFDQVELLDSAQGSSSVQGSIREIGRDILNQNNTFINAVFYAYNYLLYNQKIWDIQQLPIEPN